MSMTSNFLTWNAERDIPSKILKTICDCMPQLFIRPQYVSFVVHLHVGLIPNSSGQLTELIICVIPPE